MSDLVLHFLNVGKGNCTDEVFYTFILINTLEKSQEK